MTAQVRTRLYLEGNKYYLLGAETDKFLLDGATFTVPQEIQKGHSTSNMKGYYITYFVEDNQLYGVMFDHFEDDSVKHTATVYSNQVPLKYTGACIVAKNANDREKEGEVFYSDYYSRYLKHDYAYELFFENGILKNTISLKDGIKETRKINRSIDYKEEGRMANKYLTANYGGTKGKPEYNIIVDENVIGNLDENIKVLLGLEYGSLIKLQEGISHSLTLKAYEQKEDFVESVSYIELMLRINGKNPVKICLSILSDKAYVQYSSPYEDGYEGAYDLAKAKNFLAALKATNILETYGGGEEVKKGTTLQWYIEVKYKNDQKETISGVNKIPSAWSEYMNVLDELQIP